MCSCKAGAVFKPVLKVSPTSIQGIMARLQGNTPKHALWMMKHITDPEQEAEFNCMSLAGGHQSAVMQLCLQQETVTHADSPLFA